MFALASPSNRVVLRRRASILVQDIRCPLCNKLLCSAQILCIIEMKCSRSTCGALIRLEPSCRSEATEQREAR